MKRRRAQVGFTLLELLIAVAIFGLASVYLFDALTSSPDRANRSKLITVANMLARAKLVEVEAHLLDEKESGWEEFDDEECGDFTDDEYGGVTRFKWCVAIEKIELSENIDTQSAITGAMGGEKDDSTGEKLPSNLGNLAGLMGASGMTGMNGQQLGGMPLGGLLGKCGGALAMGGGLFGNQPTSGDSSKSGAAGALGGMASMFQTMLAGMLSSFRNVVEQAIRRVTVRVYWTYRRKEESITVVYYVTRPEIVEQAIIGGFMSGMQNSNSNKKK